MEHETISLYANSVHAFNCTAKRQQVKNEEMSRDTERVKHAVGIEELRRAKLTKRNEKNKSESKLCSGQRRARLSTLMRWYTVEHITQLAYGKYIQWTSTLTVPHTSSLNTKCLTNAGH